jgi:hypothetical protein
LTVPLPSGSEKYYSISIWMFARLQEVISRGAVEGGFSGSELYDRAKEMMRSAYDAYLQTDRSVLLDRSMIENLQIVVAIIREANLTKDATPHQIGAQIHEFWFMLAQCSRPHTLSAEEMRMLERLKRFYNDLSSKIDAERTKESMEGLFH